MPRRIKFEFSGIDKPIGVSSYELTRALPKSLQSALPTVEQIEAELTKASAACAAGKDGEALALVHASERKHGYPG